FLLQLPRACLGLLMGSAGCLELRAQIRLPASLLLSLLLHFGLGTFQLLRALAQVLPLQLLLEIFYRRIPSFELSLHTVEVIFRGENPAHQCLALLLVFLCDLALFGAFALEWLEFLLGDLEAVLWCHARFPSRRTSILLDPARRVTARLRNGFTSIHCRCSVRFGFGPLPDSRLQASSLRSSRATATEDRSQLGRFRC